MINTQPLRKAPLFSRQRLHKLWKLTGIHPIHHIRYSYGWIFPFTEWAFFPSYPYKDHRFEPPKPMIRPAHWKQLKVTERTQYHDCTATGVY